MKISYAVMTHESRLELAEWVAGELERMGAPRALVCVDSTGNGSWAAANQAWRCFQSDSTHHAVFQEDIAFGRNFMQGLRNAIACRPFDVLSFFAPTIEAERANEAGASWIESRYYVSGQAVCFPVPLLKRFLKWQAEYILPSYPSDDGRIDLFCETHEQPIYTTNPSFVEHLQAVEVGGRGPFGSVLNHTFPRSARVFGPFLDLGKVRLREGLRKPYLHRYSRRKRLKGVAYERPLQPTTRS